MIPYLPVQQIPRPGADRKLPSVNSLKDLPQLYFFIRKRLTKKFRNAQKTPSKHIKNQLKIH